MVDQNKTRILIIEDMPDVAESFKYHLERAGYVVDVVDTKRGAIAALSSRLYDVALIDLQLKDDVTHKGGIDVLDAMNRLNEGTKRIVVSATSDIRDSVASLDRKISGFIMKNTIQSSKDITGKIEEALKGYRRETLGGFPSLISYLAAPDITPIWESKVEAALKCGYEDMQKLLWTALNQFLPIIRRTDESPSLAIDEGRGNASGMFWSKADGCAIWLSIKGETGFHAEPLSPGAERLANFGGRKSSATVWRITATRDQFGETMRDQRGQKK